MASREKKNGGDFVLESRHLVGLFLLLVVIFGVVFTLGYLLGRSQYDLKLRAAVGSPLGSDAQAASPPVPSKSHVQPPQTQDPQTPAKSSDWDFYHSAEPQSSEEQLQPAVKTTPTGAQPVAAPKPLTTTAKVAKPATKSSAGTRSPFP